MSMNRKASGAWIRMSVDFPDHPKALELSAEACWLYVCGLMYAGKYLTDGVIPKRKLPSLAHNIEDYKTATRQLLKAGLWEWDGDETNIIIHDYLEWQTSRKEVDDSREAARLRMEKSREKRAAEAQKAQNVQDLSNRVTPNNNVTRVHHARRTNAEVRALEIEVEKEIEIEVEPLSLANDFVACEKATKAELRAAIVDACDDFEGSQTRSSTSYLNRAVLELYEIGASVSDVAVKAGIFKRKWPDALITPSALTKHWPTLTEASVRLDPIDEALRDLLEQEAGR